MAEEKDNRLYTPEELYALELGANYIEEHYPDYDTTDKKITLSSKEDVWVVTYELPLFMAGGSPVVEIDKKSTQVVRTYQTQ